ncbi:hypothetical protein HNQ94_002387 [Salirhabdus euzebyi]|uniref:N-acetyltransferase domain-containing protein n=1 Tax=Salirhabdus euzebyi TaxID=394506 RepID=A0A841Q6A2_9BACI|nr:hypothetical protein [Salirhabdus euzebyi]MBB6453936.1 hypothetical protein [Salirhabdus euzebyi]
MLTVVQARDTNLATLESFFGEQWPNQKGKQDLFQYGRFIEWDNDKKGFFALVPCGNSEAQLRTLYFKEEMNPAMIMLAIDWVKKEAERERFKRIVVLSHNSSTDTLFKSWGFEKLDDSYSPINVGKRNDEAKWWGLHIHLSTPVDKPC